MNTEELQEIARLKKIKDEVKHTDIKQEIQAEISHIKKYGL